MQGGVAVLLVLVCNFVQTYSQTHGSFCPPSAYTKYPDNEVSNSVTQYLNRTGHGLEQCRRTLFSLSGNSGVTFFSYYEGLCLYYKGAFSTNFLVSRVTATVGVICTPDDPGVCGSDGFRTLQGMHYSDPHYSGYSSISTAVAASDGRGLCKAFTAGNAYSFEILRINGLCRVFTSDFNAKLLEPAEDGYVVQLCDSDLNCDIGYRKIHRGMLYSSDSYAGSSLFGIQITNFQGAFSSCTDLARALHNSSDPSDLFYSISIKSVTYNCKKYPGEIISGLLVPDLATTTTIPCVPGCPFSGFKYYKGKVIQAWVKRVYLSVAHKGTGVNQASCEQILKANVAIFYSFERANEREMRCVVYRHAFNEDYLEDSPDEGSMVGEYCAGTFD